MSKKIDLPAGVAQVIVSNGAVMAHLTSDLMERGAGIGVGLDRLRFATVSGEDGDLPSPLTEFRPRFDADDLIKVTEPDDITAEELCLAFVNDMQDWAAALEVPFAFPRHFPMRSILPLRAALAPPGLTTALYRAAWGEDRRIDTPEGLAEVVGEQGESVSEVAAAVSDPAIKAELRQNTERARALGVCGVPTFVVTWPGRAPIVLWGQDRLVHLDAIGRGWAPPDRSGH